MAEEGMQRRKSTRNRGEPPMKLRRVSPAQDVSSSTSTPTTRKASDKKTPAKSTPSRPVRSTPRTRAKDSPKPDTPEPEAEEDEEEDEEEDQPVLQESMATLMDRSRHKWLQEGGIFEKFWTKPPRKKKGQPAVDMPTKAQMNLMEIGQTRIIIEPHVFDIHMYGVKKPALSWQPPIAGPPSSTSTHHTGYQTPQQSQQQTHQQQTQTPQRSLQNPYPRPGMTPQSTTQPKPTPPPNNRSVATNPYAVNQSGNSTAATATSSKSQQPAGRAATNPSQKPSETPGPASQKPESTVQNTRVPPSTTQTAPSSGSTPSKEQSAEGKGPGQSTTSTEATSSLPSQASNPQANIKPQSQSPATTQSNPIPAPTSRAQTARPPAQAPPAQPVQQQPPPVQQSAPHPDPVIQMLAQRAASDPALKELMKIVAAGSTSPEKLKEFQRHIDDINEIVKRQKLANNQQQQQQNRRQPAQQTQRQHPQPGQAQARPTQQPYRAPPFIASKPTAPPPPPRHDFANIAFDFIRGSDCYLLPRQSIIQHMPDNMTTLISFIVTRKGKDVAGGRLKADVEYYQPMTITLLTVEQKIRDIITQVVLPKDQVSREMKEIMERCTLAPSRGIMLEVPDGMDAMDMDNDTAGSVAANGVDADDVVKTEWEAPNSLLPL